jgi:hypothetical protein
MIDFMILHWSEIALAVISCAGTITALTETEKDDKIVNVIGRIVNAIVLGKSRGKK